MPQTANERIRDSLIEHDIDLRRLAANEQRSFAIRQAKLEQEVIQILLAGNPADVSGSKRQDARMQKIQNAIVLRARAAYAEHSKHHTEQMTQLASLTSTIVVDALVTTADDL